MHISASICNSAQHNEVKVATNQVLKQVAIPAKVGGMGSSVNGGELLFLALATCFCNDVYREAAKRKLNINSVEVIVSGQFGAEGEPGTNIQYEVNIDADAEQELINELIIYVDKIAEVHNTLRVGTEVTLKRSVNHER